MTEYPNVIAAGRIGRATARTMAEALAADIPSGDARVTARVTEARDAVLRDGGECGSVESMRDWREVALWLTVGDAVVWPDASVSMRSIRDAKTLGIDADALRADAEVVVTRRAELRAEVAAARAAEAKAAECERKRQAEALRVAAPAAAVKAAVVTEAQRAAAQAESLRLRAANTADAVAATAAARQAAGAPSAFVATIVERMLTAPAIAAEAQAEAQAEAKAAAKADAALTTAALAAASVTAPESDAERRYRVRLSDACAFVLAQAERVETEHGAARRAEFVAALRDALMGAEVPTGA